MIIVGGGLSGLYAARLLAAKGIDVTIIESKSSLGGVFSIIDNPLIYGKRASEYIKNLIEDLKSSGVRILTSATAIGFKSNRLVVVNENGVNLLETDKIILAIGGHELNRYDLRIYGSNPAGIFTGILAIKLMKKFGKPIGKNVVLYGDREYLIDAKNLLESLGAKVITWITPENSDNKYADIVGRIIRVEGFGRLKKVEVITDNKNEVITCDTLILGFGFKPKTESLRRFGISIENEVPNVVVRDNMKVGVIGYARRNYRYVDELLTDIKKSVEILEE